MALDARIEWLSTVDSTNAEAFRRAESGEAGPLWIGAAEQRDGRGRRGRAWVTGAGDLAASLLFQPREWRPTATPIEIATLSYVASLSVTDVIEDVGIQSPARLKWPNDVLLGGSKVAGVLLEARGPALAIGVGVNLMGAPESGEMPEERAEAPPAGALCAFTVALQELRAERILERLAARFQDRFAAWVKGGFQVIREPWLARAERFQATVQARLPHETIEGRFVDVDDDGALVLQTSAGRRRIHAADVYWPSAG